MAQKCLECLVVDGNYSKARIGVLLLGLISVAFFIWLIVLTVKLGKDEDAEANATHNETQDFEWDKIAWETCSEFGDNKIDTKPKSDLKACQEWASKTENAGYIFYSYDNKCTMYKVCVKIEITKKPGLTYEKQKNGEWIEYADEDIPKKTCGNKNEKYSFQMISMVDSLEKCKEEASKSDDGRFIFFSNSSLLDKSIPGCYFYENCDSENLHVPKYPGETYLRKIKEE